MTTTTATNDTATTATTSATTTARACLQHGLLDGDSKDCACGRQAYVLADDGDRATLRAFRKASLKARMRNFAIGGYVGFIAVEALAGVVTGTGMTLELVSVPGALCAAVGAALAYLARGPSQHRLDRLLR
jgi:hypothetical protein